MTNPIPCCPTCGRHLQDVERGIMVDLSSNAVATSHGAAHVTPIQAELAHILARHSPSFVSSDRLYAGVWRDPHNAPEYNCLAVHIYQLRHALAGIGIRIESRTGCGYRMTPVAEKESAA